MSRTGKLVDPHAAKRLSVRFDEALAPRHLAPGNGETGGRPRTGALRDPEEDRAR